MEHIITDYLWVWILVAISIGLLFPAIAILTSLSTLILAIMIGSITLTVTPDEFLSIDLTTISRILLGHLLLPFLALFLGTLFSLPNEFILGLVFIALVTPELVTPVMTELAGGNTALSSLVVVITGFVSVLLIPLYLQILFSNSFDFNISKLIVDLFLAVVLPMTIAIFLKTKKIPVIEENQKYYPAISALMVIVIMTIVTASNQQLIISDLKLVSVLIGIVILQHLLGYILGWVTALGLNYRDRIASVLSLGMRDFAVASGLILAAGIDPRVALPAVLFGIVEMISSAILVSLLGNN